MIKEWRYMKHGSEVVIRKVRTGGYRHKSELWQPASQYLLVKTCGKVDRYLNLARCRKWANRQAALNLGGLL